jgi:hypothetical protein
VTLTLSGVQADDERELAVGLRGARAATRRFYVNGRKTFFRGTHEGCTFPLTGYPPTDIESWRKVFGVVKDYGLNHVRFHSWCRRSGVRRRRRDGDLLAAGMLQLANTRHAMTG